MAQNQQSRLFADADLTRRPANRVHFSSATEHWATPKELYASLDKEFSFTLDPCPLCPIDDGLLRSWAGERVYCNPPYGRLVDLWLQKAPESRVGCVPVTVKNRYAMVA